MSQSEQQYKPIKIGNYFFRQQIGSGYTSIVYKAWDSLKNRDVAIKVIDLKKKEIQENVNQFIRNEKLILQKCKQQNLKNIVQLLDSIITKEKHYIVLEYCESNLQQIIKQNIDKNQYMDEEEALNYALQINEGMTNLHTIFVSHRDLKPANILIKNGEIKISDFGFAKFLKNEGQQYNQCVGTEIYMAPELKFDKSANLRDADMYSFGVILYQMLYNDLGKPNLAYPRTQKIKPGYKELIVKMLNNDPQQRIKWEEFANEEIIKKDHLTYSQEISLHYLKKFENKINFLFYCSDSIDQAKKTFNLFQLNHQRAKLAIMKKIEFECDNYITYCKKVSLPHKTSELKTQHYIQKKLETTQNIKTAINEMQQSGYLYASELNQELTEQNYKANLQKYVNELTDFQSNYKKPNQKENQDHVKQLTSLIFKIQLIIDFNNNSQSVNKQNQKQLSFFGDDVQNKFENLMMVSQSGQNNYFDGFFQSISERACQGFINQVKSNLLQSQVVVQEKAQ